MALRFTFRPLPEWPHSHRPERLATYKVGYERTLSDLEREIDLLGGSEVVIGIGLQPRDIRLDGLPRANANAPTHAGVELSFTKRGGQRVTFHTDTHRGYISSWKDNLRAIALGLESLRAVERYGITSGTEQYAGFAQIAAGGPDPVRGKALVEAAGGFTQALFKHHPDRSGNSADMVDVLAYRDQEGA